MDCPVTIDEKKLMLHSHHIALWDTIYSCDIVGSSDSSIRNVTPTDLSDIVNNSKVAKVVCNGKTSGRYYSKYQQKILGIESVILPSTSPANAAFSVGELIRLWGDEIPERCRNIDIS